MSDLKTAIVKIDVHGRFEVEVLFRPGERPEDLAMDELHEKPMFDLEIDKIETEIIEEDE
jgi:hypothetical protein